MSAHPYTDVAIAGVHNTRCARVLEGYTPLTLSVEAAFGVLDECGLDRGDVDMIVGPLAAELGYTLGLGPIVVRRGDIGINMLVDAARAIAAGAASTALVVDARTGMYQDRAATAPWTRHPNEFVLSVGMYTAVEFALIAQRHMHVFGTTPEQLATVAATIRNNGHVNPEAVYFGRGPYSAEDVLESRMVADPFHLLDCAMTAEGGCALLLTRADRAVATRRRPVYILGEGLDHMGPEYQVPPAWDLRSFTGDDEPNGYVGRRAAQRAFSMGGIGPVDVDVCELYDPFSFEVIRQFEAFGFCGDGEGGDFVMDGTIAPGGQFPTATDGGLLSYNHAFTVQLLQRFGRAVQQLQGVCATNQVEGAEVAIASNSGAGALHCGVMVLGTDRPR
jgi:acetyl-CoA acetyltransferase